MPSKEDIWFAARSTKIAYMPPKVLETFGETAVKYLVASEDMDAPDRIHIRRGVVSAARPRIITPQFYLHQALTNFGEEASKYFHEILSRKDTLRFLEYGLRFEKEEHSEEVVSGLLEDVTEQAAKEAQDNLNEWRGVLTAVDDSWEVSLLFFITELVKRSIPRHAYEMSRRGLFELGDGIPQAVRQEIELEFSVCRTLAQARELGTKMRDYGVFETYEDRFYDLYKRMKG